jgi:integrase/recombinase XerD
VSFAFRVFVWPGPYRLGDGLVDRYLEFVAGRCRPNTLRAVAFDLKAFFTVTGKGPAEVTAVDVFDFLAHQRGDRSAIRLADRESGLSARTIARRLSSLSGLYAYLVARGDTPVRANPVPRGLMTRRQGGTVRSRTVPLVRVPRTLPRILSPGGGPAGRGGLRTDRDRAMVLAMLPAGLRRCEVLGLRFCNVQVADRRLAVTEGKGGHHRVVPAANRFFEALGGYLHGERPAGTATDRVFVVLKGPCRSLPLSAEGLDEILDGARKRAGLEHTTCHELRHTCLTRLQMGGVAATARRCSPTWHPAGCPLPTRRSTPIRAAAPPGSSARCSPPAECWRPATRNSPAPGNGWPASSRQSSPPRRGRRRGPTPPGR